MCKKDYRNRDKYEDNKFSDGKRHTKKNKPTTDKKSRNNLKQDLRKEYL